MTTLSLGVPNYGATFADRGWRGLVTLAQQVEAAGFDRLVELEPEHASRHGQSQRHPAVLRKHAALVRPVAPGSRVARPASCIASR